MWIVEVAFGRIGSHGRRLRYVFASEPAARVFVDRRLRRRATAPARIGVAYRWVRSSSEAREWLNRVGIGSAAAASGLAMRIANPRRWLRSTSDQMSSYSLSTLGDTGWRS
jgi:hypothetical protein